ncbi:class I SAM-dependent methyltransferase [Cellulomonas fimi]|uniref:Methyltransferase type 12 n=1 Tax=Cellulomonas fimi (strain ATCC 484 / DSM 20113 / JCM 1341 / CCUG 24087 / LMG 16345 / NBRC 15513 / NCIMB 8980 / NCTC 7547 / NRS-133) TaxID=590998 RepID=F4H8I3_CELFA|nr:class I SAM-dependent methyltransferase [Cellulomonas fimi]AEE45864.1 Methyltransferase type 12 [Cellulomonas fimi ATCC 484]NNH09231.1 class I SAM-dependent methyltransferase [Cellulomonas fimi]VEH30827.1 3-demethylubiquinone-9 3-methyltransferase [Cellulomonas fimi]
MTDLLDERVSSSELFAPVGASADDVATRVLAAVLGSQEVLALYAGDRLGWYRALAQDGPTTSTALARATGTHERYVREWLEHQAVAGFVTADGAADALARRYALTAGAAEVLTDHDSTAYVGPLARLQVASGRAVDDLLDAYRTGGGVTWARLGADAREAQAAVNRPFFLGPFVDEVVPSLPDLHDLLRGGARVADVGCGEGWSSLAMARAFPEVSVVGLDVDEPSVAAAQRHVAAHGLEHRVRFLAQDAADAARDHAGAFDVVTAFECVHDMADPVAVLGAVRAMVRDGGYALVMDERTQEQFAAPAGAVERLLYGYSLGVCLPDGMSRPGSAATGTVMRPDVLERYARAAGFAGLEVLDVENEFFRFYRLVL